MFIEYLQIEKNASPYTVQYYQSDLNLFHQFLQQEGIQSVHDIDHRVVRVFLTTLYDRKLRRRSVSRTISCLKSYFKFLEREHVVHNNPFMSITLSQSAKPIPVFFYAVAFGMLFSVLY